GCADAAPGRPPLALRAPPHRSSAKFRSRRAPKGARRDAGAPPAPASANDNHPSILRSINSTQCCGPPDADFPSLYGQEISEGSPSPSGSDASEQPPTANPQVPERPRLRRNTHRNSTSLRRFLLTLRPISYIMLTKKWG